MAHNFSIYQMHAMLEEWKLQNNVTGDIFEKFTPVENTYQSDILDRLSQSYMYVHGYLSLCVCVFGICTNIINISVLARNHMRTPINCILMCLAVSDLLTMASYVPFAFHFYCYYSPNVISPEKNGYMWMSFLLFHVNFTATTHTISIWLGVSIAIFRHKHLQSPARGHLTRMRRLIRTRLVIFVIIVGSILLLIPNYLSNKLVETDYNSSIYILQDPKLATPSVNPVMLINVILYSIIAKVFPSILMIVYGVLLLKSLNSTIRRRRDVLRKRSYTQSPLDTSRTTIMLLVILVLFLVTELPQGILIILSTLLRGFFENVYIPLGDGMDIIALINNGINFVLYCTMSKEFRKGLRNLFKQCLRKRGNLSMSQSTVWY